MARALKNYLVIYHQPAAGWAKMKKQPEAAGESMQAWMKWAEKCGPKLIEMGAPLKDGVRLSAGAEPVPSKRKVSGYSIVQAASIAGAKKLMKGHPHLDWVKGAEIEVHEFMRMG